MEIAIHLGVHCTDDERLLRCLTANAAMLRAEEVAVPDPDAYRVLLRDAAGALQGAPASQETEDVMLEQILDDTRRPRRMILSWDNFLSFPQWAVRGGTLYPTAPKRVQALNQTFPNQQVAFFMAIRNPATFLPDLCARKRKPLAEMLGGGDAEALRWSETIAEIISYNPDIPLIVWCDEDTPLIWHEILEAVTGLPDGTTLQGWDDLLHHLLEEEGFRALHAALAETQAPAHRRTIIAHLLEEFGRPEALEDEFDMPEWDQATVDRMTHAYDQDVERIRAMQGVTFLTP
ncbi:hypothetical protein [Falsirhodobacter deserti]|uniref:hypothetical protein n=1 Tax=Falsirhodobacter deserti TaxID=1365611 RepID=UPI000FE2D00A|nr:hypothetical protein [Falsirhodobacter deserti]